MRVTEAMAVAALLLAGAIVVSPQPTLGRVVPAGRSSDKRAKRLIHPRLWNVGGLVLALGGFFWLPPQTTVAVVISTATVVVRRRSKCRNRLRNNESESLNAGLAVLVADLRVGVHPARAFMSAGNEIGGSVGVALRAVAARAHLGGDVDAGLRAVADESIISPHWRRLAICWNLAHEHGLAVSNLMSAAASDIAERQRFTARLDASLAGARATAAILAVLPLFGVLLGELIGARPVALLLQGGAGGWLLVVGVLLIALGLTWSHRIADSLYVDGRTVRRKWFHR